MSSRGGCAWMAVRDPVPRAGAAAASSHAARAGTAQPRLATAQRREESLLNRPLKAVFCVPSRSA